MLNIIPPDQMQFVIAQFGAAFFAFLYRQLSNMKTHHKDSEDRNELNMADSKTNNLLALAVPGLLISYLCYGQLVIHIVSLSVICYLILLLVSPRYVHIVTMVVAMTHLSFLHFDRLINEFAVSAVDITAAIMVLVQKVTCVAYGLHDGVWRSKKEGDSKFTTSQRESVLDKVPSPLEYFAYIFNFQTVICGPLVFYNDFQEFLNGTKLKRAGLTEYPSAVSVIIKNILTTSTIAIGIVCFAPLFPMTLITDSSFGEMSFLRKILTVYLVAIGARLKYFFAWTLSELISNISGLGFSGIDSNGKAQWTLMTNIDIVGFENSMSQRDIIQAWNKTTELWLRRMVYERSPRRSRAVVLTYIVSAIWHGFHPGYYLTFLTAALFTVAGRFCRRLVRPLFITLPESDTENSPKGASLLENFYHGLTWLCTRFSSSYMVLPFVLLDFRASLRVYNNLYWIAHICAFALIFIIPKMLKSKQVKVL